MAWPNPSYTRWLSGPGRAIIEDGLMLHVHRMGRLVGAGVGSTHAGVWRWSINGETCATIGYRVKIDADNSARLILDFRVNGEPINQTIWLERRPCRFGGGRWFARCPHTGRTAANLYLPSGGHRFFSRHAYRMGYRSQCECPFGRATTRRHRLAARLNLGDANFPIKPRWMRWKTFDRALDKLQRDDTIWTTEMMKRFGIGNW